MDNSGSNRVGHHEDNQWSDLNCDVVELIFSKLPEASVLRAASVCKQWYSITERPIFCEFYAKRRNANSCHRFVYNDITYACTELFDDGLGHAAGFQVQPVDGTASDVAAAPSVEEDGEILETMEAAGGLHVTFAGDAQSTLLYKLSLVEKQWRRTSKMPYNVQDPIVGVVHGGTRGHKIIVAGGRSLDMVGEEGLAVSIYDDETDCWECCAPLPSEFRGCTSSVFMSAVVHENKFYAYDMYAGVASWLDLGCKRWSAAVNLRPPGDLNQLFLMSGSGGLRVLEVREASKGHSSVSVWMVEDEMHGTDETLRLGEVVSTSSVLVSARGCSPPSPVIPLWVSLPIESFLSVCGLLVVLLGYIVTTYYSVFTRAVRFLQCVLSSAAGALRRHRSRMRSSLLGPMQLKFLGGSF